MRQIWHFYYGATITYFNISMEYEHCFTLLISMVIHQLQQTFTAHQFIGPDHKCGLFVFTDFHVENIAWATKVGIRRLFLQNINGAAVRG